MWRNTQNRRANGCSAWAKSFRSGCISSRSEHATTRNNNGAAHYGTWIQEITAFMRQAFACTHYSAWMNAIHNPRTQTPLFPLLLDTTRNVCHYNYNVYFFALVSPHCLIGCRIMESVSELSIFTVFGRVFASWIFHILSFFAFTLRNFYSPLFHSLQLRSGALFFATLQGSIPWEKQFKWGRAREAEVRGKNGKWKYSLFFTSFSMSRSTENVRLNVFLLFQPSSSWHNRPIDSIHKKEIIVRTRSRDVFEALRQCATPNYKITLDWSFRNMKNKE